MSRKNEIGGAARQRLAQALAVGEFLGIDAGAVQDEREEMPDAGVAVDDKAQRRARRDSRSPRLPRRMMTAPVLRSWHWSVRRPRRDEAPLAGRGIIDANY